MRLLPFQTQLASAAIRTYYRLSISGARVPARGPVLLVANHPNSLLDPAFVVLAAERPVRFLAKAPLFEHPLTGWLVRGWGSIPVYRRADDPSLMGRNVDAFQAVRQALAEGWAVGIFPEGMSHHLPSLAPLRTGAARMALETAQERGAPFPVVPVGLTFRGKDRFRSEALVLVGHPVPWNDLAVPNPPGPGAVQMLTRRLEKALEELTLNLERWEEAPLLERAEEIRQLEAGATEVDPERQLRHVQAMSRSLAPRPATETPDRSEHGRLRRELAHHLRILDLLGLEPRDLHTVPRTSMVARSIAIHTLLFGLVTPIAMVGGLVYGIPYRIAAAVEHRLPLGPHTRATFVVAGGGAIHLLWTLLLVALIFWFAGWVPAALAAPSLPISGLVALWTHQRWKGLWADLQRFLLLRRRSDIRSRLLERQGDLGRRLQALKAPPDSPIP